MSDSSHSTDEGMIEIDLEEEPAELVESPRSPPLASASPAPPASHSPVLSRAMVIDFSPPHEESSEEEERDTRPKHSRHNSSSSSHSSDGPLPPAGSGSSSSADAPHKKGESDDLDIDVQVEWDEEAQERADKKKGAGGEKEEGEEEEAPAREQFESKWYFLLVCVGFAVGLGNVLRFPYLVYSNGGGAFFIPYFIMLVVLGLPLVVFELGLGQTYLAGPVQMFQSLVAGPGGRFGGVGVASIMGLAMVSMYYAVLLGWSGVFLFHSFHWDELPWKGDENYFFEEVLQQSDSINDLGGFNWWILLTVSVCMVFVLLAVVKGVQGSSKVAVVTVTLPYAMLLVLLVRGVTLEGAGTGISYYLTPNWEKLLEPVIWTNAAVQIMFSLSPAWGVLITFGSYLHAKESVFSLTLLVAAINSGTSILAGFVVFSILGYLSLSQGVPIESVVEAGPTLAYVVFPAAIAEMPMAWLFAIAFFVMMILLGIDSLFASVEAIIGAVQDSAFMRAHRIPKPYIVAGVVTFVWAGSLIFCTKGGSYLLYAADVYVPLLTFFIVALLQLVASAWVHGCGRIFRDYERTTGRPFGYNRFWQVMWVGVCPLLLLVLVAIALWNEFYRPTLELPIWALVLGWVFAFAPALTILVFFFAPEASKLSSTFSSSSSSSFPSSSSSSPEPTEAELEKTSISSSPRSPSPSRSDKVDDEL